MSEVFIPKYVSKYNKLYCDKNDENRNEKVFVPKHNKNKIRRVPTYEFERFRGIN